jgi:phage shock protein PspC (stress-responsive transcriptional regulator)
LDPRVFAKMKCYKVFAAYTKNRRDMLMDKKLYLSDKDKKIAGVCGGIAEYFGIDSTIVRLIWVLLFFAYGSGLLAYIVCALVIPHRPKL